MKTPIKKPSRAQVIIVGLGLASMVIAADFFTGPEIAFPTFHLLVSAYFAWFVGLRAGIAASIVLGSLSVATDVYVGRQYSHELIPFLKAFMRTSTFVAAVLVVNRLKIREQFLNETVRKLKESNKELDYFNSMVSHDLQAPLSTIRMFSRLLQKKFQSRDGDEKEYVNYIDESASRMQLLIKELLTYAKATSTPPTKEDVNLGLLVQDLVKDLQGVVNEKKAHIDIGAMPKIRANYLQMRQLFQNLLENAIKYSKSEEPPHVEIASKQEKDAVEIYVKDNGLGFDQQELKKAFMPFGRLHKHIEGTGLGLPTCKKIVERHGGEIKANSTPGAGTTFTIRLPQDNGDKYIDNIPHRENMNLN